MKTCTLCNKRKTLKHFYKDKSKKDGFRYDCKNCFKKRAKKWENLNPNYRKLRYKKRKLQEKNNTLIYKFGISLKEYKQLLKSQNNVCAICLKKEERKYRNKIRSLATDHNHITGKVRGLLCQKCNLGISHFNEDIKILFKAISYLRERT